ncbi:MAG TPA: NAD(P)-binding domain-containing protein [Vicinamibacterales bacterium]|nr:NAD(P)-binding domain-containing protein [Vicinamibacterales bacterium]
MVRVGVIGSGDVGRVLARGFKQHGYDVLIGSRDGGKLTEFSQETGIPSGTFAEAAAFGELLVLAVKGSAAANALREAGDTQVAGKVVVDTTNPIADAPPEDGVLRYFTGPNDSLMEQLQSAFPTARFVKAFNCVGNALMVNPSLGGGKPSMFICGNDGEAKAAVARVLEQFGHDVCDMGSAKAARAIEPLCMLWCIPGFQHNDWRHAFAMLRG